MDDARQGRREHPYQTDMGATEDEASRCPAPHRNMVAHCVRNSYRRGPNDQSLLPTKFTGVTSTMAIACATTSVSPACTST